MAVRRWQSTLRGSISSLFSARHLLSVLLSAIKHTTYKIKSLPHKHYQLLRLLLKRGSPFPLSNAVASWGYSPGMPFFPAVPHDILVPDDAAQTVLNIGMTQKRFCAWRVDAAEAKELGIKKDDGTL
jgi:hypothetical protein